MNEFKNQKIMHISEIKIDHRGRIYLPRNIREKLGLDFEKPIYAILIGNHIRIYFSLEQALEDMK